MKIGPFTLQWPWSATPSSEATPPESPLHRFEDGFDRLKGRVETAAQAKLIGLEKTLNPLLSGNGDERFDGMLLGANGQPLPASTPLSDVPGAVPKGGVRNDETIIEINGIGETVEHHTRALQMTANATGSRVIGLHNATQGGAVDVGQSIQDELRLSDDKAADALAKVVSGELAAGHDVHLVAHSQGGLEAARALDQVRTQLVAAHGEQAATQLLHDHVKVETFAGAAWAYPDGPQYRHYVNLEDPVPMLFGQGVAAMAHVSHPGKDAQIIRFVGGTPHVHEFGMYLSHRQPW